MGFGTKTDLATGRKLNLDISYHALIKPVLKAKGWGCVRADEIPHSNMIDVEMYKQLLTSDVVIADLSTSNVNAFYELGIRYALRPRNTIVISEDQLGYPFDLNHIPISRYKTGGETIDYFEAMRFQEALANLLDAIEKNDDPDSPVYTFLSDLIAPSLTRAIEKNIQQVQTSRAGAAPDEADDSRTMHDIVRDGEAAIARKDYKAAKQFFTDARQQSASNYKDNTATGAPVNTYLTQRLAYATYKAREPDRVSALREAAGILSVFDLKSTNDTETVILAGRIEKKLYLNGGDESHLARAIEYHERAYFLLNSRYHAINLAFLFNNRADSGLCASDQEKLTDMVLANRLRRRVLLLCDADLKKINEAPGGAAATKRGENNPGLTLARQAMECDARFWILINKAEAHYGLGDMPAYLQALSDAQAAVHEACKMERFESQRQRLRYLLMKQGHLLSPAWADDTP